MTLTDDGIRLCAKGHLPNSRNTYRDARGDCRQCNNEAVARYKAAKKGTWDDLRVKHGHATTRTGSAPGYDTWRSMHQRCNGISTHDRYGGRGIKVCDRWQDYRNFLADMGPRPAGASLDRINNDGDYEPSNCRWATAKEQARNKATNHWLEYGGKKMVLADWAALYGISSSTIKQRIAKGRDPFTPVRTRW